MGSNGSREISWHGGKSSKTKLKAKEEHDETDALMALAAVAGVAIVGWGICKLLWGSGSKGGKTMKAPGKNYRIYRADFEDDPAAWFRNHR